MKIELEITPEIEKLADTYFEPGATGYFKQAILQIKDAIEKAKNEIKVGDLVRYYDNNYEDKTIRYFICCNIRNSFYHDTSNYGYRKENCTKATPEEEAIIRPLLEGK